MKYYFAAYSFSDCYLGNGSGNAIFEEITGVFNIRAAENQLKKINEYDEVALSNFFEIDKETFDLVEKESKI
jgi:hypothetical protein